MKEPCNLLGLGLGDGEGLGDAVDADAGEAVAGEAEEGVEDAVLGPVRLLAPPPAVHAARQHPTLRAQPAPLNHSTLYFPFLLTEPWPTRGALSSSLEQAVHLWVCSGGSSDFSSVHWTRNLLEDTSY